MSDFELTPPAPHVYAPGVQDTGAPQASHRLSIKDPIGGGFMNVDGGASCMASMTYQILVELRILNAHMQQLVSPGQPDVDLRADHSIANPEFAQTR